MGKRTALVAATFAALALATFLSSAAASAEKSVSEARLEVTYYYLPT